MKLTTKTIDRKTIYQLIWLRSIAVFLQLLVLGIAELLLGISLPIAQMLAIILFYFILHIFIYWQYQQDILVKNHILFFHLILDVIILCCLLYFAGGATNPFISLLLFPLTITATVLSAAYTWYMAIIVIISYSLLMRLHISLPHNHADGNEFSLHIWGMWFGFLLSAALVSFFIVSIRKLLEQKELLLHDAREQAIKDKQLISLATLSASTAHELGTPLATIGLLCDELNEEVKQKTTREELVLPLKQQVIRCKEILSVLSTASGTVHLEGGEKLPVDKFIAELIDSWQKGHLKTNISIQYQGIQPAPSILAERLLHQAIVNILDNSQKVSQHDISCLLNWDKQFIYLTIKDSGPGLDSEQLKQFGKHPQMNPKISQKEFQQINTQDGMGIGSFLSYTIIERMGGKIDFANRKSGGLSIKITLPIRFS